MLDLFALQVEQKPNSVALIDEHRSWTYGELDRESTRLAQCLRLQGVIPETLVGLCLPRNGLLLVGLLSVLKAGGAVVPLDPDYPTSRLHDMLKDASPPVFLLDPSLDRFPQYSGIKVSIHDESRSSEDWDKTTFPSTRLLEVIYTSGSTGQPKGTLIPIDAVMNRLSWMWKAYPFQDGDVVLWQKSVALIASAWECWGGLLQGIPTLMVSRHDLLSPKRLWSKLIKYNVSYITVTPPLLQGILDQAEQHPNTWTTLRLATTSASPVLPDMVMRWRSCFPDTPLLNLYGSTECASNVTVFDTRHYSSDLPHVPLGQPIDNTEVYVLNDTLEPVPEGSIGEMVVSGACVTRGYLHQPTLTKERFVSMPQAWSKHDSFDSKKHTTLYRTGDLVRRLPGGDLLWVGRRDRQVKIRGFRVELGDIEATLTGCENVLECAVVLKENEHIGARLVAYVVTREDVTNTMLRTYLQENLPAPMLPSVYIQLDALPKTLTGKIDYNSLPELQSTRPLLEETYVPPQTPLEKMLCVMLQDIVHIEPIGVDDTFLDLGLHSLLLIQWQHQLHKVLHKDVPILMILSHASVRKLARALDGEPNPNAESPLEPPTDRANQRKTLRRAKQRSRRAAQTRRR